MERIPEIIEFIQANWDAFLYLWSLICTVVVVVASVIAELTDNEVDPKTTAGKIVLFADRFAIRKEITTEVKRLE